MNTAETFALEGRNLSRRYGGFKALDDVSITLRRGEIRGLIGPNGAGKSTLISVLCEGDNHSGGTVIIEGRDITNLPARGRRRAGLGRSFQRTNIFPELTVEAQVALAAKAVGADDHREVLAALDLSGLADRQAADISYGDQRRLDIALALTGRPPVLLLDEPAAGLSFGESLALARLLRDLAGRWGVTVLIVEHDMEVIFSTCDRITVMHLGRILTEGVPDEIRTNPEVIKAYLGSSAHELADVVKR